VRLPDDDELLDDDLREDELFPDDDVRPPELFDPSFLRRGVPPLP